MAIIYDPKKMLRDVAPESKIKKLVNKRLDVKKASLSFISDVPFIDKSKVTEVALKTVKSYNERVDALPGEESKELQKKLSQSPMQLIQRVQNEVVWQVSQEIQKKYEGEQFEWLPSDAEEPDPEHQLNYGKIFTVGSRDYEGREFGTDGCKCGMRILVKETELELD